jgi:hypothetical protein
MKVIIPEQVKNAISRYSEVLCGRQYGCSKERAVQKRNNILKFLKNLENVNYTPQVCIYKDLGQEFNKDGMPLKKNLYTFYYDDKKAHTQWAFGVYINREEDKVTIDSMKLSSLVKEDKTAKNQIVIKDSELRAIINEAIREEIDKLLNGSPQYNYLMS